MRKAKKRGKVRPEEAEDEQEQPVEKAKKKKEWVFVDQDSDSSEPDSDGEYRNWCFINVGGLRFKGQWVVPAVENIRMRRGCQKCGHRNKIYCGFGDNGWKIRPGDKGWLGLKWKAAEDTH